MSTRCVFDSLSWTQAQRKMPASLNPASVFVSSAIPKSLNAAKQSKSPPLLKTVCVCTPSRWHGSGFYSRQYTAASLKSAKRELNVAAGDWLLLKPTTVKILSTVNRFKSVRFKTAALRSPMAALPASYNLRSPTATPSPRIHRKARPWMKCYWCVLEIFCRRQS